MPAAHGQRLAAQEPAHDEPTAEADDDADNAAQGAAQGEASAAPATGTTKVANPARTAPGPALRAAAARNAERVVSLISSSADLIAAMPPRLRDAAAAEMQERLRKIDLSWAPQITKA